MEKYEDLKKSFRELIIALFPSFEGADYKALDRTMVHFNLFHRNGGILKSKEYLQVAQEMGKHPEISSHCDKLVGTLGGRFRYESSNYIHGFLMWCIWGKHGFDEVDFDKKFLEFIEYFNSPKLLKVKECRLFNFTSEVSEIEITDSFKIVRDPIDRERLHLEGGGYKVFSASDFKMVQTIEFDKIINDDSTEKNHKLRKKESEEFERVSLEANRKFDNVIRALRLLKSSACYRDHGVDEYYAGFLGNFGSSRGSGFLENTAIGNKCELTSNEIDKFKGLWKALDSTDKLGDLSTNRLSYVVERRNTDDKVLDCFIGLESLYLPDGNTELTFRLSLRVAKVLEVEPAKQKELFKFIKNMYGARSKLAHGTTVEVPENDLKRLEETLRASVIMYLESKEKFKADALNARFF